MVTGKKEAVRAMLRKNFSEDPVPGRDHRKFCYVVDGEIIFKTKVSHGGSDDLDDYLLGEMAKQCHLDNARQFFDFVKCRISKEQYRQILIDKGIIKG
jgi:hypothetical protein